MTARLTCWPSARSARSLSALRIKAEISWGAYSSSPICTRSSEPIRRLMESTVRSGATMYWLRACWPTMMFPSSSSPTHEGKIPSSFSLTIWGCPPAMMATSELVVPRSMPTIAVVSMLYSSVSGCRFTTTSAVRSTSSPRPKPLSTSSRTTPSSVCSVWRVATAFMVRASKRCPTV